MSSEDKEAIRPFYDHLTRVAEAAQDPVTETDRTIYEILIKLKTPDLNKLIDLLDPSQQDLTPAQLAAIALKIRGLSRNILYKRRDKGVII